MNPAVTETRNGYISMRLFMNPRLASTLLSFTLLLLLSQPVSAKEDSCQYCGMRRSDFGHSWMVIQYDMGDPISVCSVHCAVVDIVLHTHRTIRNISVADYNTREQIDAEKAFWVIGGDRIGVMTARAKWAFSTEAAAEEFIRRHGGRSADFEAVIQAAFEDMYQDTMMIHNKRRMMNLRNSASPQG